MNATQTLTQKKLNARLRQVQHLYNDWYEWFTVLRNDGHSINEMRRIIVRDTGMKLSSTAIWNWMRKKEEQDNGRTEGSTEARVQSVDGVETGS